MIQNGKVFLTGTRCNDNFYYLDQAHLERALAVAHRMHSLPHFATESKSDFSGTSTIEDDDTDTSEIMSEDGDEDHQSEHESEYTQIER